MSSKVESAPTIEEKLTLIDSISDKHKQALHLRFYIHNYTNLV